MTSDIEGILRTEFSEDFTTGMKNRMLVSFHKYGPVKQGYPHRVDAIESLRLRLQKYQETGNTEYLMDVANFAMIEFMLPRHPNAYFKAEDSDKSPGRIGIVNQQAIPYHNKDIFIAEDDKR